MDSLFLPDEIPESVHVLVCDDITDSALLRPMKVNYCALREIQGLEKNTRYKCI